MALHTAGSIGASSLFSMGEYIDRVAQFSTRGRTSERSYLTPWDYSQEVVSGIHDNLNDVDENGVAHAVLDENIPIIGGMGMGDAYSVFHSAAQSWVSANTVGRIFGAADPLFGRAAVLADTFANSASSSMDAARRAGADGRQAMSLGLLNGVFETATELLPLDKLMDIGPSTTVKDFVRNTVRLSAAEGLGEFINAGLGAIADYAIMDDLSAFSQRHPGLR